ncbi:stAR-related lipid transfer protein 13 [Euwallacea fornicatus]|uniref:stAR-related lipid transfer protein 13 n=1 Tax=Euwallacea fornicatus TaxID=995702 RepID=UPI00339056C0
MNYPENYQEFLQYIAGAEGDINGVFENPLAPSYDSITSSAQQPKINEISRGALAIDIENNSDPEDIQHNLQILLQLDKNIRSDLAELLANHELNDLTVARVPVGSQFFQRKMKEEKCLNHFRRDESSDDSDSRSHHTCFAEDEKSIMDFDIFSEDMETHSTCVINGIDMATQTSPSVSSTNLTWESSSSSDVECSEESLWEQDTLVSLSNALNSTKSNSAPFLEKVSPQQQVNRPSRSQSDRHLTEIEASDACKWLRATGFPQYAQMYEDMQFPIEIYQVAQDHPFLEKDALHSLFRRLKILNSCAHLHQHRIAHHTDDSDEEFCALSDNWTYQSDVRRWSRTCMPTAANSEGSCEIFDGDNNIKNQYKDDVFEKNTPSNRGKLKRLGSSKSRRRRDGICFSEREVTVDLISPLCNLRTLDLGHLSDPELIVSPSSQHYTNLQTDRLDKSDQNGIQSSNSIQNNVLEKLSESITNTNNDDPHKNCCVEEKEAPLHTLTAAQLQVLRKLALLKLTAYMEKFCPSHRTGWTLDLTKLIRKFKAPVYKDKNVFGVPVTIALQRSGQVLPRNIEEALRWLQLTAVDQVGIFRRPGVKSRIQALRNLVETNLYVDYSDQQSYDVADMVKQYFRELPEVLLTNRLSETFILIFQHVPHSLRKESILWASLLLPDEHLELLQALLHFMLAISKHSDINQMNESNLAMCFEPTLFHHAQALKQNSGSPHPKELAENKAGYECLLYFLKNYDVLFKVPTDILKQCKTSEVEEAKAKLLDDLGFEQGGKGWREYLNDCQANLLRETKDKQRGWISVNSHQQKVEIAYKKVADGIPLRLWKVTAEIEAPPFEVLHRILRERHIWDLELRSSKIVIQLEPRSEVYQFVRGSIAPRPSEEYCVVRTWRTDLGRDACLLVETSVEHPDAHSIPNTIRGLVLASRYLVEPCGSGKSRLIHLSRIETMGRAPDWYHKHFGHLQALFLANIQGSFRGHENASGPESKV